jgi:hypothetical protein
MIEVHYFDMSQIAGGGATRLGRVSFVKSRIFKNNCDYCSAAKCGIAAYFDVRQVAGGGPTRLGRVSKC